MFRINGTVHYCFNIFNLPEDTELLLLPNCLCFYLFFNFFFGVFAYLLFYLACFLLLEPVCDIFLQYLLIIMYYCYVNEYLYIRVPLKRNSLANHCLGHTTRNTVTGNTTKKTTLTFYQWAAWPEMAPSSEERETRVSCPDTLFWVSIHVFHKFYWLNS